ncbi:hypothetical protein ACQEVC_42395 [Plantactinospora sp. CA-294935]|uniref:hypothetical protein n=1 Tax=Plantactinospora sp. CA-294935 TaxID=3240012 RepID=UPI003D9166CD
MKGFVGRCGTQFCVDGKTFYFAGSNTYDMFTFGTWSDDIDARSIDTERIDGHFARLQRDGVSVLRLWMFSHEAWHGFEPAKGVFNESQFVLFDYIIASAGRHGIRLLPVLENYWTAYGGIDARLRWEGLPDGDEHRGAFFDAARCSGCSAQYKAYVQHALTRVNTYTGVAYRDDPVILGWDLMNEPRYEDEKPGESGAVIRSWVDEMGAFVKSIDQNHMVTIGLEGNDPRYGFGCGHGNPFIEIYRSPYIDFTSTHVYPMGDATKMTLTQMKALMRGMVHDSHNVLGKPFYLAEFNVDPPGRAHWWTEVFAELERSGGNGIGFWWYQDRDVDAETGVAEGAPELAAFRALSERQAAKSGGTPTSPQVSAPATPAAAVVQRPPTNCPEQANAADESQ